MAKPLTDKQQRFVDEYLVDLNATQAAIRAGYSPKAAEQQGTRLLSYAQVSTAIATAKAKRAERVEISQDYVIATIVDTMERCRQVRPVLDREGNPVHVEGPDGETGAAYVFDPGNVLKGADMLAKHLGLYERDNSQRGTEIQSLSDLLNQVISTRPKAQLARPRK